MPSSADNTCMRKLICTIAAVSVAIAAPSASAKPNPKHAKPCKAAKAAKAGKVKKRPKCKRVRPAPKRPAPNTVEAPDIPLPTDAEEAQHSIDRAIYTNIWNCSQPQGRHVATYCLVQYNNTAYGSVVPPAIATAVEAAYVTRTATQTQTAMLNCWLTWNTSRDYFPPLCIR